MRRTDIPGRFIPRRVRRIMRGARDARSFFLEFMKHPATVGSVCPSSDALAGRLVENASAKGNGLIIDLGAGSGAVSASMIRAGIARERIIAVEALREFSEPFAAQCPGVRLIIADARNLKAVLDTEAPGKTVCAVVSSLPFRALGPTMTREILRETHDVLRNRGGIFVQYSYAWWLRYPLRRHGFAPGSASVVWKNLPPARVEVYESAVPSRSSGIRHCRTLGERLLALAAALAEAVGSAMLRTSLGAITGAKYSFSAIKDCWHEIHGKP